MSQDDLAAHVYVSCQTISSRENGKTYPDVQSLPPLSEIFDTSIDELIKGDVETMTNMPDSNVTAMKRLGLTVTGFLLLMLLALIWLTMQLVVWERPFAQTLPTAMLALALWGIAMFAAAWVERITKEHDLITYQEILAFWHGGPVDRGTPRGRRMHLVPVWMKAVRTVGLTLLAAAIGAFVGYGGTALADALHH